MKRAGRRSAIALGLIGGILAVAHHELPTLAEWKLRRELKARGFPEARFDVVDVGLDRLVLADVELAPGLALGTVEIDAGVSMLWRDPQTVSIRGARVEIEALGRLDASDARGQPFRTVQLAASVLVVEDRPISVDGTVELSPTPSARLVATTPAWPIGSRTLRDLVLRIDGDRACGDARLADAVVAACTTLELWKPVSSVIDWRARAAGWTATGNVRLTWTPYFELHDGHAELAAAQWSRADASLDNVTIKATFAGTLDAIGIAGTLRADRARSGELVVEAADAAGTVHARVDSDGWRFETGPLRATARTLRGTIDGEPIRAAAVATRIGPLVAFDRDAVTGSWTAGDLELGDAHLIGVAGSLERGRATTFRASTVAVSGATLDTVTGTLGDAVRWRAAKLRYGEATMLDLAGTVSRDRVIDWTAESTRWRDLELAELAGSWSLADGRRDASWRSARLGPMTLGRGTLSVRGGAGWTLQRGSIEAFGGRVELLHPAAIASRVELGVRGVQLQHLLAPLGSRARGRGSFDGSIVIEGGELRRVQLEAKGPGAFQVGDRSWVDRAVASIDAGEVAVAHRIGGALADFEYGKLAVVLSPAPGTLRIALHGTGRRVRQELDLVINVRGLREAAALLRAREAT